MVPKDQRFTNLTVDDVLLVRGRIVARSVDANMINGDNPGQELNITNLNTTNITTQEIKVDGDSANTNVLFTPTPANVTLGAIPQFSQNARTEVAPLTIPMLKQIMFSYLFLGGSDGNVTLSGANTLTRDMYYDTLTIDSTGVVDPQGWFIFCKTAFVNNGLIRMNGGNGNNAAGAVAGTGGTAASTVGPAFSGGNGRPGGAVNTNGGSLGIQLTILGGAGGTGGNSDTKTGGAVTSTLAQYVNPETVMSQIGWFSYLPLTQQPGANIGNGGAGFGGGGGAGGTTTAGGGGGAGGGWIFIIAPSISGSGTIESKGGNGGDGGAADGGGGGGGGGGVVYTISISNTFASSQVILTGGSGGTGGTTGQNGTTGSTGRYQVNLL